VTASLSEAQSNKRLERTPHERASLLRCVGEPLERNVRRFKSCLEMRPLILLTLVLLIAGTTCAQTDRLSLDTKITDQKYCGGDYTDMAMLRLSLQLTYTNDLARPLILYKGSDLISYVLIAADSERILAKQYESNIHVGWVTSGPTLRERAQPGNEFIVLQPRESFRTSGSVNVPVALEPASQFLKSGQHVMQVVVETWPTDEPQLARLRKKWERSGYLWGANVRSEPMPFIVEAQPKTVECK